MAHRAGAWIFPPLGELFPYDDRHHSVTVQMYRAAAANFHAAGGDGLYLSNLPWPRTDREYALLREMGDPDAYARKSKHYPVAQEEARTDPYAPRRELPRTLGEGEPVQLSVLVADALDAARQDKELQRTTLGVRIVGACPEDHYSFRLNDHELAPDDARISSFYGGIVAYFPVKMGMPQRIGTHYWFEFDLPINLLREGANSLEVTMEHHFKALTADRVLQSVEIRVEYEEPPLPAVGQM